MTVGKPALQQPGGAVGGVPEAGLTPPASAELQGPDDGLDHSLDEQYERVRQIERDLRKPDSAATFDDVMAALSRLLDLQMQYGQVEGAIEFLTGLSAERIEALGGVPE